MDEFIALLNDERQLLDELLYRLVAARGVLAAGEMRFVARASAEIEQLVDDIFAAESRRAAEIAALAARLGWPAHELTLRSLAAAAPEPYHTILEQLHVDFLRLTDEIERTISVNKTLATRGAAELSRLLSALGATGAAPERPLTYAPSSSVRRAADQRALEPRNPTPRTGVQRGTGAPVYRGGATR